MDFKKMDKKIKELTKLLASICQLLLMLSTVIAIFKMVLEAIFAVISMFN